MKSIVIGFLVIAQLVFFNGFGQTSRLFTSLEEASSVSPDSVFRLDLSKSKLKEIPSAVLQFKNLRELNLEKNKISQLPSDFFFEHLEILNLTKNEIQVFPEVICQNTSLKQLLMGKNNMDVIPDCIGELQNLIILDVWFNPITDLPMALTELKNLKALDLRGMNFSSDFQKKWAELLPWVKIEFDLGCDCGH